VFAITWMFLESLWCLRIVACFLSCRILSYSSNLDLWLCILFFEIFCRMVLLGLLLGHLSVMSLGQSVVLLVSCIFLVLCRSNMPFLECGRYVDVYVAIVQRADGFVFRLSVLAIVCRLLCGWSCTCSCV
jgi:hypothetical protein